jgi:hypothetical protein
MRVCWDIKHTQTYMWLAHALGWGLPLIFLTVSLSVTGVSYRMGGTCIPNPNNVSTRTCKIIKADRGWFRRVIATLSKQLRLLMLLSLPHKKHQRVEMLEMSAIQHGKSLDSTSYAVQLERPTHLDSLNSLSEKAAMAQCNEPWGN